MKKLTLAALLSLGIGLTAQADNSIPPLVKTTQVSFENVQLPIRSSGVLENKAQQKLSFKISGIIKEIFIEEGDKVAKGQLLAILDQQEIKAQVKQARSVLDNAQSNLNRFKKLYEQKLISSEQLQSAQTQMDVAQSDLSIALFNLKHSEIRATSSGKVLRRLMEEKELVTPNQPAFLVSNDNSGWIVRVGVSDKDIVKLSYGNAAAISFDAYPDQLFTARVSEIAAAANQRTRLFEVELELAPHQSTLYNGFIGRVEIDSNSASRVAMLPIESLVTAEGKKAKVFVVDKETKAQPREVLIGFIQADKVAISQGIEPGEMVITKGASFIQPGLTVRL